MLECFHPSSIWENFLSLGQGPGRTSFQSPLVWADCWVHGVPVPASPTSAVRGIDPFFLRFLACGAIIVTERDRMWVILSLKLGTLLCPPMTQSFHFRHFQLVLQLCSGLKLIIPTRQVPGMTSLSRLTLFRRVYFAHKWKWTGTRLFCQVWAAVEYSCFDLFIPFPHQSS